MDKYLSDVKQVWPLDFDHREEIALQFLSEVLRYRDIDVEGGAVRENLVAFPNDLRLANRSHATLATFLESNKVQLRDLTYNPPYERK